MIKTILVDREDLQESSVELVGYVVLESQEEIRPGKKDITITKCVSGNKYYTGGGFVIFKAHQEAIHHQLRLRNPNIGYSEILKVTIPPGTKYTENNILYCSEEIDL